MAGAASEAQMAGLLVGLYGRRAYEPSEVAGGVRALRKAMLPVSYSDPERLVDTCGTGGGSVTTFNISTACRARDRGCRPACGEAREPVLHLEVRERGRARGARCHHRAEPRSEWGRCSTRQGIVFMFAPAPAPGHEARRDRCGARSGISTIMNILGPLTNPAGARRQVVGVADPALLDLIPGALQRARTPAGLSSSTASRGWTRSAPWERPEGRRAEAKASFEEYEITPADARLSSRPIWTGLAGGDPTAATRRSSKAVLGGRGMGPLARRWW